MGGPSRSAIIAGHCLRAPGGSWDFPGTISHRPLQKVHPSSDANGPVQEKQQAVPADGHLPLVSRLLPSGGQFLAQNEVWLISPWLLGARRKLLPLDWEQGAFPPGRDMGSEGVRELPSGLLRGPAADPEPWGLRQGSGWAWQLGDKCWAARADCGGLGCSAWWEPFLRAGQVTASCRGWPRPPARRQGFPLCSGLGSSSDIPGPFIKLRPHWGEQSACGRPQTFSPTPPFLN